jgi:hypothetical protein
MENNSTSTEGKVLHITRNRVASPVYDDFGYCDTRIRRGGEIFSVVTDPGTDKEQIETFCTECLLAALLSINNPISAWYRATFVYVDEWQNDYHKWLESQSIVKES